VIVKSLFSVNPADMTTDSRDETERPRVKKLIRRVLDAYCHSKSATHGYELALGNLDRVLAQHVHADAIQQRQDARACKLEMAREALELAKAVSELLADAIGSWVPASDQAGTGLDVLELEMIGVMSGKCEAGDFTL
jgi:hypothetical protein